MHLKLELFFSIVKYTQPNSTQQIIDENWFFVNLKENNS